MPKAAPTPLSEPENGPGVDFAAIVEAEQARPRLNDAGQCQIECIVDNVHLGDGRQIKLGERAFCAPEVAEAIVTQWLAAYV